MKRSTRVIFLAAASLVLWVPGSALAATAGTWTQEDAAGNSLQASSYSTAVLSPINADGSSNFPKKRGVIPVQFSLSSTTGTIVLQSICEGTPFISAGCLFDGTDPNDYGFVTFQPVQLFTFADVTSLIADYEFTEGDCVGGALRWSIRIDMNGSGTDDGPDGSAWLYYGSPGSFGAGGTGGCTPTSTGGSDQSGVNMMDQTDGRWDTSQLSGGGYGQTLTQTRALLDTKTVLRVSLVLDGGWADSDGVAGQDNQVVTLASATVNDNSFSGAPAETVQTCDLPQAGLRWTKSDNWPDGGVNEAESIQPKDAGEFYRIVDCKYIYNLDVSSLDPNAATRAGTYRIGARINGVNVQTPAKFDLR